MNNEIEELRQRMSSLPDDALMSMLMVNPSDYRREALNLATEEVLRRHVASGSPVDESFLQSIETRVDSPVYRAFRESNARNTVSIIFGAIILMHFLQYLPQAMQPYHPIDSLVEIFGIVPVAIVGGLLILPLGIMLFAIRESHLMLYARVEILFGMLYGIYTIGDKNHWGTFRDSDTSNLAAWTALAASLYIVVRGLDNRNRAMIREKEARELEEKNKEMEEDVRHKEEMYKIMESLKHSSNQQTNTQTQRA